MRRGFVGEVVGVFGMVLPDAAGVLGAVQAVAADLSTIGLVVTAPDAAALTYPLNTPVLINSADDTATDALGATGSIANQIDLINAQLSGFAASARIVIVRVEEGVDDDATMVNLIEGIAALEDAESMLGVAPRLISVPGFTHQQATPQTGNPVVAALPATLEKLVGMAVITGPHDTLQGYTDWRETISHERLIPVETWVKVGVNATVFNPFSLLMVTPSSRAPLCLRTSPDPSATICHPLAMSPLRGEIRTVSPREMAWLREN